MDLDAGALTIRRTARLLPGWGVVMTDTKTAKSRRTIDLSHRTVALLQAHRSRQRAHRLRVGPLWKEYGLVFPSRVGTPGSPRNFYRLYRERLRTADVQDVATVGFHALRHTAATQWIRTGADIHTASRRLGEGMALENPRKHWYPRQDSNLQPAD